MTTTTPRSELVRRRRLQQTKRRFDATAQAARTVKPLISRPRATGAPVRDALSLPTLRLPHFALPSVAGSWRTASLSLVLLMGVLLARWLTDPARYVDGINLAGAALVPGEEIYAESGVAKQHIFWIDPVEAQKKVAAIPGIASATITVKWPSTVTIAVTERVPVITWIEGEKKWWVDVTGQRFKSRGDLPGLLPITLDEAGKSYEQIPVAAIEGALQLRALRPNIELLHYDSLRGLSYADGRHWRGYFGVGLDMPQKLAVYETLVDNLVSRGIQPALISVENLKAPYYRK